MFLLIKDVYEFQNLLGAWWYYTHQAPDWGWVVVQKT